LKIINNPSSTKLLAQIDGIESIENLSKLILGEDHPNEIFSDLAELKRKAEILLVPDQFNENFASLGWIAYESFNFDVMKRAIEIAETLDIETAEKFLTDYYNEETLNWKIQRFKGHPDFRKRLRLIELAKDDYLAARYHACIPLLISLTDGLVNDVSKHVGLVSAQ
jgi:hypothetical protein